MFNLWLVFVRSWRRSNGFHSRAGQLTVKSLSVRADRYHDILLIHLEDLCGIR